MATLYRKSAKGVSEIQTREHRLAPRARSALILVDGRRTDDDLRALIQQQPDETLIALVAQGFIEVVDVTASPPAPAATASAAAPNTAPGALAPPAPTTPSPPTVADLRTLCREAVHALNDQVGPMAEPLAIRLERARSFDEIRPLLEAAAQMVYNVRGAQAAATYRARYLGA